MKIITERWIDRHMRIIKYEISTWSKDPNTGVAALIVDSVGKPISWGYNGPPMGVMDTPRRLTRPHKYKFMAHAERNAIDLSPVADMSGSILFTTHSPCSSCATSIVQKQMAVVVCDTEGGFTEGSFVHRNETSIEDHYASIEMFTDAGIRYIEYDMSTGDIVEINKFEGEPINVREICR